MSAALALPARVTHAEATALTARLVAQLRQARGPSVLDASALDQFDTSALAVVLACRRAARAQGHTLTVQGLPARAQALAQVYGVSELLLA